MIRAPASSSRISRVLPSPAPSCWLRSVRRQGSSTPGGRRVAEHRGHQGGEAVDVGGHHQDVAGFEARVGRQQLQQPVAHDLHLAQPARTGMELQGAVVRIQRQPAALLGVDELLLQLGQQGGLPGAVIGLPGAGGGGEKEVLLLFLPQLGLAGALQQLLEFPPQPAEAGLKAGSLQQPGRVQGLAQGQGIAELAAAFAAAAPEVAAGGQKIEIHRAMAAQGLQQLHLDRRHAAEAEQAQRRTLGFGGQFTAAEPGDQVLHPPSEGIAAQLPAQGPIEQGLPALALRQRPAESIDRLVQLPGPQHLRPVEGVIVEGIGDGTAQLPVAEFQSHPAPHVPSQWRSGAPSGSAAIEGSRPSRGQTSRSARQASGDGASGAGPSAPTARRCSTSWRR